MSNNGKKPEPMKTNGKPMLKSAKKTNDVVSQIKLKLREEPKVVKVPTFSSIFYTFMQVLVISSIVSALWVMAFALWWIKYYVECNQGVIDCE
jgi:hypothetical protein